MLKVKLITSAVPLDPKIEPMTLALTMPSTRLVRVQSITITLMTIHSAMDGGIWRQRLLDGAGDQKILNIDLGFIESVRKELI